MSERERERVIERERDREERGTKTEGYIYIDRGVKSVRGKSQSEWW